ncbi:MAG: YcxB family protein [Clostridia bacterium]|nr:YcxB family protein [Clostridia bacterium]
MNNNEFFENENVTAQESTCPKDSNQPEGEPSGTPQETPTSPKWYVDLNREEYVAFRMLSARLVGPLRLRKLSLVVAVCCFLMLGGFSVYEWVMGWVSYPDPVLVVGALLTLIPAILLCGYIPYRLRRDAERQYDRTVEAGMDYYGELTVFPDCIEKTGAAVTGHIRIDERMLFIETEDMMVVMTANSPAIVLPARCLTTEMATAVREAAERIPMQNRRFEGRVKPRGEAPIRPAPKAKPEELWVTTFTYTAEEYAVVLKGIIQQHFWRMAPLLAAVAMMASLAFGYNGESLLPCVLYFAVFIAVLIVINLVLPLGRVKPQTEKLSAHDLTVQVRFDTMALRLKLPKGAENMVLWCDVDHVYEREDFVEIVHNKKASLFIPKRCIPDLDAFDAIVKRCRGER